MKEGESQQLALGLGQAKTGHEAYRPTHVGKGIYEVLNWCCLGYYEVLSLMDYVCKAECINQTMLYTVVCL